jgi:SAM-dependent methyltransferase
MRAPVEVAMAAEQRTAPSAWASADSYERYVGRWSRLVAAEFLDRLDARPGLRWLDVGCGTGALSSAILARCAPLSLVGVEPAPPFLAAATERVRDPRASFRAGTAEELPLADAAVDAVVSGLVLNFLPDRPAALAAMRRVTAPGGVVAGYVWDYADGMQLMRCFWDAAVACDPAARELDEANRFPDCAPDGLQSLFEAAGLADVAVEAIVVPTRFADFADYWSPFLGATGPAPVYVASLDGERRVALREELRRRLPIEEHGGISLTARAWAVHGRVPDAHAPSGAG